MKKLYVFLLCCALLSVCGYYAFFAESSNPQGLLEIKYDWQSDCQSQTFSLAKLLEKTSKLDKLSTMAKMGYVKRLIRSKDDYGHGPVMSNVLCFSEFFISNKEKFNAYTYNGELQGGEIFSGSLTNDNIMFSVIISPDGIIISREEVISPTEKIEVIIVDVDFDGVVDYGGRIFWQWNPVELQYEGQDGKLSEMPAWGYDDRYKYMLWEMMSKHGLLITKNPG